MVALVTPNASLAAIRDRALLLLGFAGAFRRSELVALDIADVDECPEGLRITIRKSKTDQDGAGQVIAIPRGRLACPVGALRAWLDAADISEGPLSGRSPRVAGCRIPGLPIARLPASSKPMPPAPGWIRPASPVIPCDRAS